MGAREDNLTEAELDELSAIVQRATGINLNSNKRELVRERLHRRMRQLSLGTFHDYYNYLAAHTEQEFSCMVDALTTNVTSFFRESKQFDYLTDVILRERGTQTPPNRKIRIWSAGCSSGEEPYSVMIACLEKLPDPEIWDLRILATDLSSKILDRAKQGLYKAEALQNLSGTMRAKYFERLENKGLKIYRILPQVKKNIVFARLNLIHAWPLNVLFDVIYCRNVMIYFEKRTQEMLIGRFWEQLTPGGTLFIGQAESLAHVQHNFDFIGPAIYRKSFQRP